MAKAEPKRFIQQIIPASGSFSAVVNHGGRAMFRRIACWALVEEVLGKQKTMLTIGLIVGDRTTVDDPADLAGLVFADEEPGFVAYAEPEDEQTAWDKVCADIEASEPNDDDDDDDNEEEEEEEEESE